MITDARNGSQYIRVCIYSRKAVEFIERYIDGNRAWNKKFKDKIIKMQPDKQMKLLEYMIIGDGCKFVLKKPLG